MVDYLFYTEWIAVALNIVYVILAALEKRSCWIFGGVASIISIWIFYQSNLPSEAVLYFFYFVMAVVGYSNWNSGKKELKINKIEIKTHMKFILFSVILASGFFILSYYLNGSSPIIDAFTTGFSIVATYMTIKKILSNWIYWIIIDIVSIFLYHSRGLEVYAIMMSAFTILAIFGYIKWKKEYQLNSASIHHNE